MSRWTDQYMNHPFHGSWQSLTSTVASASLPDGAPLDDAEELARIVKVVAQLDSTLAATDPELGNLEVLGSMQASAQAALGEVQTFLSSGNVGHLRNANAQIDALSNHVQRYASTVPSASAPAVVAAAASLGKYVTEWHRNASSQLEELNRVVEKIDTRSVEANLAIDKLIERMTTLESQFQNQMSSFTQTFMQSEASRAERYDKWHETQHAKADDTFSDLARKYTAGLAVLTNYEEQAGKVLGSVVNTAQAGAYATYANEEKTSANTYRRLAISLMAVAALVLFLPELWHVGQVVGGYTVDWQKALYRLPFSLVLFAPAVYLAKESSRHRNNEVLNRRRQHILTTIEPYLALLDSRKAEEVKTEVARSLFSDAMVAPAEKSEDTSNILAQLSNLVTTIIKQKR
ncbi:hypothetical protein ACQR5T_08110 [Xanthomonas oryzae pv. oryzicola]|uniref:hypothetical protein n=1 Tax=Xanthomonas oryzae TaxID=347 RepID=UPI000B1C8989|nr:hypothetical protein [Xanthomonas oryzae]